MTLIIRALVGRWRGQKTPFSVQYSRLPGEQASAHTKDLKKARTLSKPSLFLQVSFSILLFIRSCKRGGSIDKTSHLSP